MPLYEYECTQCGRLTEVLQRMSDPPLAECPDCGGPVEKVLSAPAFQFKGTGWYVTDYARKDQPPDSSKAKTSASSKDSGSSTKSDDKPAPKPTAGSPSD